jgi:hypothetical protein
MVWAVLSSMRRRSMTVREGPRHAGSQEQESARKRGRPETEIGAPPLVAFPNLVSGRYTGSRGLARRLPRIFRPSGVVARPYSLTVAGAAQALFRIADCAPRIAPFPAIPDPRSAIRETHLFPV